MTQRLVLPVLILLTAASLSAEATPVDSTGVPETSVYHLSSTWTTQDEASIQLSHFRGQPQLVALVYTHCGSACPLIVHNMKRVLDALSPADQAKIGRVLVSIDPERDTPERLREFARIHHLNLGDWTLLRGTDMDVRELAAILGVRYQQEASGMFSHSSRITVLDADGVIVHQQQSINQGLDATVRTLHQLLSE